MRGICTPERNSDTGAPALYRRVVRMGSLSDRGRAIASGLDMWSVEDQFVGPTQRGKLLVTRSDRG